MQRRRPREYFDRGLQLWIIKTAHAHHWRVASWVGPDDLIQEGFVIAALCRHRYSATVRSNSHFMSLVKVCFLNRLHDLAKQRSRNPEQIPISQIVEFRGREEAALELLGGVENGDQELVAALRSAPAEIQALLVLLNDPVLRRKARHPRRRPNGCRETHSEQFNRLLKLPIDTDLPGKLRELLVT
jgi:hypothetical protein